MKHKATRQPLTKLTSVRRRALAVNISKMSRFIILAVLCLCIFSLRRSFFTINNILNILKQMTPVLVLSLGQMVVILTRGIDLSMGAVGALSGVVTATLLEAGQPVFAAILAGLAIGVVFGWINGILVTRVGLPPFVATFGSLFVGKGIVVFYIHGRIIWGFPDSFRFLGTGQVLNIPFIFIVGVLTVVLFYLLLNHTSFGVTAYSVGSNPVAARISGIRVKRILTITYVISGLMAAFACLLYISRLNSAKSDIGEGFEMDAIAGALIGGTSFEGGIGTVSGTVLGVLIIVVLRNAMNLLGVAQIWHGFATGLFMIAMILADELIKMRVMKYQAGV